MQGTTVTFNGTLSVGEINGTVSAPGIGQGTFHMVPAPLHFGHLEMQGNYKDVQLSVNTQYALGQKPKKTYFFGFGLNLGTLGFETRSEPSATTYKVSTDEDQPGSMFVSVSQNGPGINATAGTVDFTRYDSAGAAGSFNVSFPDGSSLIGGFDLVFYAGGTASVQGSGMWSAAQASVPTFCFANNYSGFVVSFLDNQLSMELKFHNHGDLGLGDYAMPTDAWLDVQWRPRGGGPDEIPPADLPGTLHITSFSSTGIAGSFSSGWSAGGTIAGNFDVSF